MIMHTTKFNMVVSNRVATVFFRNNPADGNHEIKIEFCGAPSFIGDFRIVPLIGGRPQIKAEVYKLAETIWTHLAFKNIPKSDNMTGEKYNDIMDEIRGIKTHIMVEATAYLRAVGGIQQAFGK